MQILVDVRNMFKDTPSLVDITIPEVRKHFFYVNDVRNMFRDTPSLVTILEVNNHLVMYRLIETCKIYFFISRY